MSITVGFDVYGTLIDTNGVVVKLREMVENPKEFSRQWREKQLEYSFRRALMQNYENFAVCTRDALDYTCAFLKEPLKQSQKDELLAAYRTLPAFDDVEEGLAIMNGAGFRTFAFSNGSAAAIETVLGAAGIREHFLDVISTDDLKSFKPNPAVYSHFLRRSGASQSSAWLVSSNPFDVMGAISAGMKAVWLKRSPDAIYDPWGIEPTLCAKNLQGLADLIARHESEVTLPGIEEVIQGLLEEEG